MYRRRALPLVALATAAALSAVLSAVPAQAVAAGAARVALPALSGPHQVGTAELHLVDTGRQDPWHPNEKRELMVTVTYPAWPAGARAPWLSAAGARVLDREVSSVLTGPVDWVGTTRRARTAAPVERVRGGWPVVLFSPGFGVARELNATITDDLASHGYVVVSMAHTYESQWVEFPNGRVVEAEVGDDPASFRTALEARIADTRFVLDEVTHLDRGQNPDAEHDPLPRGLAGSLDLSDVGVFGHSYGGFTAAETMYRDQRFDAGVNLDGSMVVGDPDLPGDSVLHGVGRPFMLVGSDAVDPATGQVREGTHTSGFEPSWGTFWTNQRGWKRDLHFSGSAHLGFTDYQVVLPQLSRVLQPGVSEAIIGTIDPTRSARAQHEYLAGFFDLHLKHRDRHLFDHDDPRYPATRFVP
ncbi:lipase [Actinosynnema sp. NPDC020468]|uniref:alpha/beta hydrolase family protein n=1 Tax=Actinosynnema sp. NPDC020468 TaxID=3154488 RepID=UPI003406BBEC